MKNLYPLPKTSQNVADRVDERRQWNSLNMAVCLAFLLGVDEGTTNWRRSRLDLLVLRGAKILAHHQSGNRDKQMTLTDNRVVYGPSEMGREISIVFNVQLLDIARIILDRHKYFLVSSGEHFTAVMKRHDRFLVFHPGAEPRLREVQAVRDVIQCITRQLGYLDLRLASVSMTRYKSLEQRIRGHGSWGREDDLPSAQGPSEHDLRGRRSQGQGIRRHESSGHDHSENLRLWGMTLPDDQCDKTSQDTYYRDNAYQDTNRQNMSSEEKISVLQGNISRIRMPEKLDYQLDGVVRKHLMALKQLALCPVNNSSHATAGASASAALERDTFSYHDSDTKAKTGDVATLVQVLMERVGRRWIIFKGCRIEGVGSYYDGTRVSQRADEFDFLVSVECEEVKVDRRGSLWYVWVTGDILKSCKELESNYWQIVGRKRQHGKAGDHLLPGGFYFTYREIVGEELAAVTLPEGLTHAGLMAPAGHGSATPYSGVTDSCPAVTLSVSWRGEPPSTIDITPAFAVPTQALKRATSSAINMLTMKAGLPQTPAHPAHLVPGASEWQLTTSRLEICVLSNLGPQSPVVKLIRALKLLARRYLQWGPLECEVRDVELTLGPPAAAAGGSPVRLGDDTDVPVTVAGGQVIVANLKKWVGRSLEEGQVRLSRPRSKGCREYMNMLGLVVAVLCRTLHDEESHMYSDLKSKAREVMKGPVVLHPAVGEALGVPTKPWVGIRSTFIKYMVLGDFMEGRVVRSSERELRDFGHYIARLSRHLEGEERQGRGLRHPLLGEEPGLKEITPRCFRQYREWGTPLPLLHYHSELCRQLAEVCVISHPVCETV